MKLPPELAVAPKIDAQKTLGDLLGRHYLQDAKIGYMCTATTMLQLE